MRGSVTNFGIACLLGCVGAIGMNSLANRAIGKEAKSREIRIEKSFPAKGIDSASVSVKMGNIHVYTDSPDEIRVKTVRTLKGDAISMIPPGDEEKTIKFSRDGSILKIEDQFPKDGQKMRGKGYSSQLEVEIHQPRSLDLSANSGMGNASAEGDYADLRINSGMGNVSAEGSCDEILANSGMGNVAAKHLVCRGDQASFHSGMGDVTAKIEKLPKKSVTAESGMGNASIALPSDARASVTLETGMGKASSDFPLNSPRKSGFEMGGKRYGDLNGGGTQVTARSGMGNARLTRSDR